MAEYEATVVWRRGPDEAFAGGRYSRAHEWRFDGGAVVPASSSPHVVRLPFSDPAAVDPEEAFVAALASCHMLFFLGLAAGRKRVVERYEDRATGTMAKDGDREWVGRVVLRPRVTFAGEPPDQALVDALHHEAHARCYIANSVRTEVVVEGTIG